MILLAGVEWASLNLVFCSIRSRWCKQAWKGIDELEQRFSFIGYCSTSTTAATHFSSSLPPTPLPRACFFPFVQLARP